MICVFSILFTCCYGYRVKHKKYTSSPVTQSVVTSSNTQHRPLEHSVSTTALTHKVFSYQQDLEKRRSSIPVVLQRQMTQNTLKSLWVLHLVCGLLDFSILYMASLSSPSCVWPLRVLHLVYGLLNTVSSRSCVWPPNTVSSPSCVWPPYYCEFFILCVAPLTQWDLHLFIIIIQTQIRLQFIWSRGFVKGNASETSTSVIETSDNWFILSRVHNNNIERVSNSQYSPTPLTPINKPFTRL